MQTRHNKSKLVYRPYEVVAYHNHGRWVVRCPSCNNAQVIYPGVDQVYICGNRGQCTEPEHVHPIVWPEPEMVLQIQRLLDRRPIAGNRNWHPGETLAALRQENAEHGIA